MRWCRGDVFDGQLDFGKPLKLSLTTMSLSRVRQHERVDTENEGPPAEQGFPLGGLNTGPWKQSRNEVHVSSELLRGLLPDALCDDELFTFWRTGESVIS